MASTVRLWFFIKVFADVLIITFVAQHTEGPFVDTFQPA